MEFAINLGFVYFKSLKRGKEIGCGRSGFAVNWGAAIRGFTVFNNIKMGIGIEIRK